MTRPYSSPSGDEGLRVADPGMQHRATVDHRRLADPGVAGAHDLLLNERVMEDGVMAQELAAAVAARRLSAVFQPQVEVATGRVVAAEGLCRWVHPIHGPIAPDAFIPVAERTGLIHQIGRFMLRRALEVALQWKATGRALEVSVNVSPLQMTQTFADDLRRTWSRVASRLPRLTVEITETQPIPDLERNLDRLSALRDAGLGVSLDDYGTGYASRSRLDTLPLTEVKLDRTMLADRSPRAARRVSEIVRHAHAGGLVVVAEGVEDSTQFTFARDTGCDRAQGYLLGHPMTGRSLQALVAR